MVNKLVKGKTGSSIRFNKNTGWWRQRSCSFPLPSNEAEANALQAEEKAKCFKMDLSVFLKIKILRQDVYQSIVPCDNSEAL